MLNIKCRNNIYPKAKIKRFFVPDDKHINSQPVYADPPLDENHSDDVNKYLNKGSEYNYATMEKDIIWNAKGDKVNRISHMKNYRIINGLPINPIGRTGIIGRGNLGKWGPNHAIDLILTKWHMQSSVENDHSLNLYNIFEKLKDMTYHNVNNLILQFLAIKRKDNNQWAFPGGMVDNNEDPVKDTSPREFAEESLNLLSYHYSKNDDRKKILLTTLEQLFAEYGSVVYQGYVDDPRNTDNAWIETVATNIHLGGGPGEKCPDPKKFAILKNYPLQSGDDAIDIRWIDVVKENRGVLDNLYASHLDILGIVLKKHNCTKMMD
ncbi:unnamed protein product [Gordionus sp. m RMFG-2023]